MTIRFLCSAALAATCLAAAADAPAVQTTPDTDTESHTFTTGNRCFLLDGKPFVIKAAELHYPRIPRPYWDHRIKMCKALGMNTICLYVFWNVHEQTPGNFDFTGQNDIREFIELCRQNDMKVILRPGPYVCAEWEMGGLPWWLLRDKDISLRTQDPRFMRRVELFQKAVAQQTRDLTVANGGPIIMIQVENEYGSYGKDKPYIAAIRDILRDNYGDDITLFQCDWSSNFLDNGLDDLVWTMNFGTGADIDAQFAELRRVRPDAPLMCSEFWSGWFDKWGARHETRSATDMIAGIEEMLSKEISFSLYMTHGGTNWSHWAGANSPGYAPDVTSYDYDAPINESGQPTSKYWLLRDVLQRYNGGIPLPDVPQSPVASAVDEFVFDSVAPLWSNCGNPVESYEIRSMEELGQGFGSIIYSTTLPCLDTPARLTVSEPHDYAQIFIDGTKAGTIDRRLAETELTLPPCREGARLDILVEATGRINFGRAIKDFKGITDSVTLTKSDSSINLKDWRIYSVPDDYKYYKAMSNVMSLDTISANEKSRRLPAGVYTATFRVDSVADTFLDMSSWGKGLAYVNGHGIGRFWETGPQQTLYMPGCWLRQGENEMLVFDILGPRRAAVRGLVTPVLDMIQDFDGGGHRPVPDTPAGNPALEAILTHDSGRKYIRFEKPYAGRYLYIEVSGAIDDDIAIAELYLTGIDGESLTAERWRVAAISSEDTAGGNHTGDKAFDRQESTFWRNAPGSRPSHAIVIDLGSEQTIAGIGVLPRMEPGAPQSPGKIRIYISNTSFNVK